MISKRCSSLILIHLPSDNDGGNASRAELLCEHLRVFHEFSEYDGFTTLRVLLVSLYWLTRQGRTLKRNFGGNNFATDEMSLLYQLSDCCHNNQRVESWSHTTPIGPDRRGS